MLGVVLWRDDQNQKAIVWCEDHGNLAFYKPPTDLTENAALETGDFIQFDLQEKLDLRYVQNPKLLSAGYTSEIDLLVTKQKTQPSNGTSRKPNTAENIVPFPKVLALN